MHIITSADIMKKERSCQSYIKWRKCVFMNEWESCATRRSRVAVTTGVRKTALNSSMLDKTFYSRPNIQNNNIYKIIIS